MRGTGRTRRWLWRWRSSPLRRREDVVEAWIVLALWAVVVLGGALVGTVTVRSADESLARVRAERHAVRAVLLQSTEEATPLTEGVPENRVRARIRWTAPDGSVRSGRALVPYGREAGTRVPVWTDDAGRLAPQPPTAAQAAFEAELLGVSAVLALGGLVYGAGRAARWRLDRRRLDGWARDWNRVEPGWRRTTT